MYWHDSKYLRCMTSFPKCCIIITWNKKTLSSETNFILIILYIIYNNIGFVKSNLQNPIFYTPKLRKSNVVATQYDIYKA